MEKATKVSKSTKAPSEEPHFENINAAIKFGNVHVEMFNQMQLVAGDCNIAIIKNKNENHPGNAYALVVNFLDDYSKAIIAYNALPFGTEEEKKTKEEAAKQLDQMLFEFQDKIKEKAMTANNGRAPYSVALYDELVKIFDNSFDPQDIAVYVQKIGNAIKHALSPATWRTNLTKEGGNKLKLTELPAIPDPLIVVPELSGFGMVLNTAKYYLVSFIRPVKQRVLERNNTNNNNSARAGSSSVRDAVSVVVKATDLEALKKLYELPEGQVEFRRDRDVEFNGDLIIVGGIEHPLKKELDAYNDRAGKKKKAKPGSDLDIERTNKTKIAGNIGKIMLVLFPEVDVQKTYDKAIDELRKELKAIEIIEKEYEKLLPGTDLKGILSRLKIVCQDRLKNYEAGAKKQKEELDLKFKKPTIEDVLGNKRGAFHQDKLKKFNKNISEFNDKDKFILSHVAIADVLDINFADDPRQQKLRAAYIKYHNAIDILIDVDRNDENDPTWQIAAEAVNDAYKDVVVEVNSFNNLVNHRAFMFPMHDVLAVPAPVAWQDAFRIQHYNVIQNMVAAIGKASSSIKTLSAYKVFEAAYIKYEKAMRALNSDPENRSCAAGVEEAYKELKIAVDRLQEPASSRWKAPSPQAELAVFANALLHNGKAPITVPPEQVAEVRRESVKNTTTTTTTATATTTQSTAPSSAPSNLPAQPENLNEIFAGQVKQHSIVVDASPKGQFVYQHEQLIQAIKDKYELREVFIKRADGSYTLNEYKEFQVKMDQYNKIVAELKEMKKPSMNDGQDPWAVYEADQAWQAKAEEVNRAFEDVQKLSDMNVQKNVIEAIVEVKHDIKLPADPIERPAGDSPRQQLEKVVDAERRYNDEIVKKTNEFYDAAARTFNVGMTNIRKGIGAVLDRNVSLASDKNYQAVRKLYDDLQQAVLSPDHESKDPRIRENAAKKVVELYGELKKIAQANESAYFGVSTPVKGICKEINQWMEKNPLVAPTMQAAKDMAEKEVAKPADAVRCSTSMRKE